MYMILFVLHDTGLLEDILNAWEETNVGGVTIFASTGLRRMKHLHAFRDDLPLLPSLSDILSHEESLNRTLMTLVPTDELVDKVVAATEKITGPLSKPNTGVLAVLPIARLYGA